MLSVVVASLYMSFFKTIYSAIESHEKLLIGFNAILYPPRAYWVFRL